MSRLVSSLVAVVLLLQSTPTQAQEEVPAPAPAEERSQDIASAEELLEANGNLVCFDYYSFGSVEANLVPELTQTIPGVTMRFEGSITNSNPYPLIDGNLYVKIFRRDDATFAAGDGNQVVDQFFIKEDITIPGNGSAPASYEWTVPMSAEGGEYYAAYFFNTSDRYNLMGLSFTEDIVGSTASFSVTNDSDVQIAKLNKIGTTLNGKDHHFAAVPLHFDRDEIVTIKTTITNPTDQAKNVPLQWNQYAWDAMNSDNRRNTETELITLEPNETKEVAYTVKEQREGVVYVTASVEDLGTKSILNVRYVRDWIDETRINFPSITKFPLVQGEEQTLFSCAHAINRSLIRDNTLTLTLEDKNGNLIHSYKYAGGITGDMAGFGDTFTPNRNYNYVTLNAVLEREGVIIEQVKLVYDCNSIDASSCLPEPEEDQTFFDRIMNNPLFLFGGALILILLLILIWSVQRRHNLSPKIKIMYTKPPMSLLLFLLLIPALFFATGIDEVEAKSVSWNKWEMSSNGGTSPYGTPATNNIFAACAGDFTFNGVTTCFSNYSGFKDPNIRVSYEANIKDAVSLLDIPDTSELPVGTCFIAEPKPLDSSDIFWFATPVGNETGAIQIGPGVFDSPNGYWRAGATPPALSCTAQDYVGQRNFGSAGFQQPVYAPLSINPPAIAIDVSASTAGLSPQGGNQYCVTSPGNIRVNFNYPATTGEFYFRQGDNFDSSSCLGTQREMFRATAAYNASGGIMGWGAVEIYNISPYTLNVPSQTIAYNLTAAAVVPANNPPNPPTINGSLNGTSNSQTNVSVNFTFLGTDPDGDQIQYEIDWDRNAVTEVVLPTLVTFVNTGTSLSNSRLWSTANTYTFQARTKDSNGAYSAWTPHTVTVSPAPIATADLKINGSDGPLTVAKSSSMGLTWTHANAGTCNIYGDGLPSGQLINVPASGSHTIPGGAVGVGPETYVMNCTAPASDGVNVTVQNQPPAAPTIAHVGGNRESGETQSFTFRGTDPDNDQIFYEIDWDNNGTVDVSTPGASYVASGTTLPGTRSWPTTGSKTFQARTVDFDNARSNWTTHNITIVAGPPPTVNFEAVNTTTGERTTTALTIGAQENVTLEWTSSASSCTATAGSGFSTSNSANSSDSTINEPAADASAPFTINCGGVERTITITSEAADLSVAAASVTVDESSFNGATMTYANGTVSFIPSNVTSRSAIPATTATLAYNGGRTAATPGIAGGTEYAGQITIPVTNVPVGSFSAALTLNQPQSVGEKTRTNNTATITNNVGAPDPGLKLRPERTQVRQGDTTNLEWSVQILFPMACTIAGPGINPAYSFSPSTLTGTIPSGIINAKSTYTFSCTAAGSTWTTTADVETVGTLEEV